MVKQTQVIHWLLLTNYLSVSDHFVGLGIKGLSKIKSALSYSKFKEYTDT